MHIYTTVNNGCLVHFFFVEQVEFLLFPLFWFQPLLGMFLPGHVPFAQLMAFHGVSVPLGRSFCTLDRCDTERCRPPQRLFKPSFSRTYRSKTATHLYWHQDPDIRSRPVPPTQINRITITEGLLEKVGLVLEYACISVCVCICAFATPAGWGPWTTLTRAIKVYKREAQLSVKLTDCPRPTLLWREPHETPENPWPRSDRELTHAGFARAGLFWAGTGLGYGG